MADDIFGQPLEEVPDIDLESPDTDLGADTDGPEMTDEPGDGDALQAEGEEPADAEAARKYWQGAYTKSRQKDRERYGELESEHTQYKNVLAQFYQNDDYARQVLAQRFPQLASQIQGQSGQASPAGESSQTGQSSGLVGRLQQKLGEFGFLAEGLGSALEEEIESRVQARVGPLEQRTAQHTESQRKAEEDKLLAEMDGKYPGWEDSFGAQMRELDDFLGGNALNHSRFGNKYELYYRLLNPDAARSDAIREMGNAARRRTGLSRTGRSSAPNIGDQIRKAESNADAFALAAKSAMEESA